MIGTRRDFLRKAAGATGAAAALSLLPDTIARALAIPANARTGSLQDVEHIVVYMQENRSFDHYFGAFDGVRGLGDTRPLRLPGGNTVWRQPSEQHADGYVMPFWGDSTATNAYTVDGSDQGHQAAIPIVNGGRYDGWGGSRELHKRMVYHKASDLPFYHALASAFTICDAYHCSTLTQTYPNRLHLWTGCNGGGAVGGDPQMDNYGEDETPSADMATDRPLKPDAYRWTTYAERLEKAGISWKIYQEYDNFGDNILSVFPPFRPCAKESSFYRRGRSWVSEDNTGADRTRSDGEQLVAAFRADLAAGTLPQVSWIVTAADLSEHPQAEPSKGEHVCAELIRALADNPEMFAKTIFIINYDEAGGFYDHMLPPMPPLAPEEGFSTVPVDGEAKDWRAQDVPHPVRHPLGLGIRVPALIVSPWSRGGYVCSEVFDHTSVLRLIGRRFGVTEPNISPWRRSVCGDLTSAFDFAAPNRDWSALTLPATADYLQRVAASNARPQLTIPAVQTPSGQSNLRRPSRALPYDLAIDGRFDGEGRFAIAFTNRGTAGAVFTVHDNADRRGPWRFTIGAGHAHTSTLWHDAGPLEAYDLTVHGPDGFYRRFAGGFDNSPELIFEEGRDAVTLVMRNPAAHEATLQIAMAAPYAAAPADTSRVIKLAPGEAVRDAWPVAASGHWYDLSVDLETVPAYRRRFAGRLRTGRDGKTDPGIGAMVLTS